MRARCIAPFYDKKAKADRAPGDVFECTEARFKEINSTEFGELAAKVQARKASAKGARADGAAR